MKLVKREREREREREGNRREEGKETNTMFGSGPEDLEEKNKKEKLKIIINRK